MVCGAEGTYNEITWTTEYPVNSNITITNFHIKNGYIGFNSQVNATIANNTITGSSIVGITLDGMPNNQSRIYGNTLIDCSCGIAIRGSDSKIFNNTIRNCETGMFFIYGYGNQIFANSFNNTGASIHLDGGSNLRIFQNKFLNCQKGVSCININGQLFSSNIIYLNDFINITDNVVNTSFMAPNPTNSWDNGTVGNYWSNYFEKYPNASEVNGTGTSGTSYVLDAGNVDWHPLMEPFEQYLALATTAPTIPAVPNSDPTIVIETIVAISVAALVIGAVVYFKKTAPLESSPKLWF